MTRSGLGLTAVSLIAAVLGLVARWPEMLIVAAVFLGAVLITGIWRTTAHTVDVHVQPTSVEVHRLEPAVADVSADIGRRRAIHVEVLSDAEPRAHHRIVRSDGVPTAAIGFPTARRQVERHGPFLAVWGDPLGLWRRVVGTGESVELVVTPRRGSVDDDLRTWNPGDEWESPKSLRRSHLTELLTEYVAGDEPRRIHWRTSARMGRLMVRQRIGTESRDTLVYLDCDPQAWRSAARFDDNDTGEQFELGVELAAAVVRQLSTLGVQVAFLTEADEHPYFVDRVSAERFGRRLAEVSLQPTAAITHAALGRALRAHRFRRVILVTFQPSTSLETVLASRGRGSLVKLITPMPPAAVTNERFPVESVQWIPAAG